MKSKNEKIIYKKKLKKTTKLHKPKIYLIFLLQVTSSKIFFEVV